MGDAVALQIERRTNAVFPCPRFKEQIHDTAVLAAAAMITALQPFVFANAAATVVAVAANHTTHLILTAVVGAAVY